QRARPPARGGGRAHVGLPSGRRTAAAGGGGAGGAGRAGAGTAGGGAGEQVNFNFSVRVDRRDEWKQLLDESYRVMKYRYYDATMHGKDWPAIYTRYSTLLADAGTNEVVYDIANAMIGELSISHTGGTGPPSVTI